jgi:hypothetical protein
MNKMFYLLFTVIYISIIGSQAYAFQQQNITLNNEEEYRKFRNSNNSANIKFDIEDYIGTWTDPLERDCDLIVDKDLIITMDDIIGKCKNVEQTNNILILKCSGEFGIKKGPVNVDGQYVRLQIFYYPDSPKEASQRLNITFHFDLDCAKKGKVEKECFFDSKYMNDNLGVTYINKNYDMYERSKETKEQP